MVGFGCSWPPAGSHPPPAVSGWPPSVFPPSAHAGVRAHFTFSSVIVHLLGVPAGDRRHVLRRILQFASTPSRKGACRPANALSLASHRQQNKTIYVKPLANWTDRLDGTRHIDAIWRSRSRSVVSTSTRRRSTPRSATCFPVPATPTPLPTNRFSEALRPIMMDRRSHPHLSAGLAPSCT